MPEKSEHTGGWTKGKRRNADRGDWGVVLLSLTALLDNYEEEMLQPSKVWKRSQEMADERRKSISR
jgi:hypothetical protein